MQLLNEFQHPLIIWLYYIKGFIFIFMMLVIQQLFRSGNVTEKINYTYVFMFDWHKQ